MSYQLNLNVETFLSQYWQQKPLLLRKGFTDFADPVAAELLAGLAMEDGVDARIIESREQAWNVIHGPFEDYEAFGETDWTLLVQSVNEWFPQVQQLLEPFRFMPDWRLDDVMVSFATEGGGVGPHLDQYDVFIIQGAGSRRWRVGNRVTAGVEQYCPHPDLQQLKEPFHAIIDEVLEPGDVLYIPANCPHDGIALEPCLNYSIGFRAPNQAELISLVADAMLQSDERFSRYLDPQANSYGKPFQVSQQQLDEVKTFLADATSSSDIDHYVLRALSQSKRPLPQPLELPSLADLHHYAQTSMLLCRTPGARLLLNPTSNMLFVAGEQIALKSAEQQQFAEKLAAHWQDQLLADYLTELAVEENAELLVELLQLGVFQCIAEASEEDE